VVSNKEPDHIAIVDVAENSSAIEIKEVYPVLDKPKMTPIQQEKPIIESVKQLNEPCTLTEGKVVQGDCTMYKYLEKMDLEKYTNLVLHSDVSIMIGNGEAINIFGEGMSIYELGLSDQGKVYQMIFFDWIGVDEFDHGTAYFLNSKFQAQSINFLCN